MAFRSSGEMFARIYTQWDKSIPGACPPFQAFFSTDACMAVAFQLGIDNTSPTITYSPFTPNTIARNATSGWTPYYTNIGFPLISGRVGDGTSLQISSQNGSFFSITWSGASPFSSPQASLQIPHVPDFRSIDSAQVLALISTGMQPMLHSESTWIAVSVEVLAPLWSTPARISSPRSQTYDSTRTQSPSPQTPSHRHLHSSRSTERLSPAPWR